nr:MAG TPA: hypothetical protein [Caudoviricetes sp.]
MNTIFLLVKIDFPRLCILLENRRNFDSKKVKKSAEFCYFYFTIVLYCRSLLLSRLCLKSRATTPFAQEAAL